LVGDVVRSKELLLDRQPGLSGQRIAFLAENSYDYVGNFVTIFVAIYTCKLTTAVMLFSILAADAIAVPLSPAFPVAELKYILNHSEASTLLATERYAEKARALVQDGFDQDLVVDIRPKIMQGSTHSHAIPLASSQLPRGGLMLYTSGTTNRPV
jgi:acyl-CoA synthetase (AMP-forming)/AMP-acid ligase II